MKPTVMRKIITKTSNQRIPPPIGYLKWYMSIKFDNVEISPN